MEFLLGLILVIVCISLLAWIPEFFLNPKNQKRYLLALIVALAVPFAAFAYGFAGFAGLCVVGFVAGIFVIANLPSG